MYIETDTRFDGVYDEVKDGDGVMNGEIDNYKMKSK